MGYRSKENSNISVEKEETESSSLSSIISSSVSSFYDFITIQFKPNRRKLFLKRVLSITLLVSVLLVGIFGLISYKANHNGNHNKKSKGSVTSVDKNIDNSASIALKFQFDKGGDEKVLLTSRSR